LGTGFDVDLIIIFTNYQKVD